MADILALFGVILLVGAALCGLLTTHWLLFPGRVAAAATNLEQHPWRCVLLGAGMGLVVALPVILLMALPAGVTQFLAWVVMVAALAVSGIGTAGLVLLLAGRVRSRGGTGWSELGAFVGSSLVLELAAVLPIVGWFVVLPLVILGSFGASLHGLRRPMPADSSRPATAASGA